MREPITCIDGQAPGWQRGILKSAVFCVICTPAYFRDPLTWEQAQFAKRHGKPFRVLLKTDTPIPEGYFDGIDDIRFYPFTSIADLEEIATQLRTELREGARHA